MAVRGGKALVLAMLISFLLVQGTLGEFGRCYCNVYRDCKWNHPSKVDHCKVKAHNDCRADFNSICPKSTVDPDMGAAFAHQINGEGGMTGPAGRADHGKFNVAVGSMAVPAGVGGADHGKLNVAEASVAVPADAEGADHGEFIIPEEDAAP